MILSCFLQTCTFEFTSPSLSGEDSLNLQRSTDAVQTLADRNKDSIALLRKVAESVIVECNQFKSHKQALQKAMVAERKAAEKAIAAEQKAHL